MQNTARRRTQLVCDTRRHRMRARTASNRAKHPVGVPTDHLASTLHSLALFEGIPKADLARLAKLMRPRNIAAGEIVFAQGDPAREFFVLSRGRVVVTVKGGDPEGPPIAMLTGPTWFGDLAIVSKQPRISTVTAETHCEFWILGRPQFERFFLRHPRVARNLAVALIRRLQEKDRDFTSQSTLAIERARLLGALQQGAEQLAALIDVTRAINVSLDLDQTLRSISTYAARLTRSDSALIFLYDQEQEVLTVRASYNAPAGYLAEVGERQPPPSAEPETLANCSLTVRAVVERRPVQIADVDAAPLYRSRDLLMRWGYRAVLVVPLLHDERVIGAMSVLRRNPGEFMEREIDLVTAFAGHSAIALEHARLFHQLREKAAQLEVVSRHKSQFLASMSHELRTPLNAIIGFSEILLDPDMDPLPEAERQEFLTSILTSGKHLLRLINDILDLSKVEAGKMDLHPAPVSLSETTEGVLATLKSLAAKKQLRMECRLAPNLPPVWADPARLKQILYNLVSNAIKFTPAGGRVSVTARTATDWQVQSEEAHKARAEAPLDSKPRASLRFVEVGVMDTGIGIPAEDQDRIFGEFEQVPHSGRQRQEGTGLGLALVKKLVEKHGGVVGVASTPDKGSTFTFTIPVAD